MTRSSGLRLLFLLTALAVVVLDQLTKGWVRLKLPPGQSLPEDGFFRLTHIRNSGAVFGLMADPTLLIIVSTLAGIFVLFLYLFHPAFQRPFLTLGLGLLLGGAVGNLVDRLILGYVTDFIDIRVWPIFNLADSATVVSIIMLGGYFLLPTLMKRDKAAREL